MWAIPASGKSKKKVGRPRKIVDQVALAKTKGASRLRATAPDKRALG